MNKLKVIGLAAFVSLLSQPAISGQFVPREYQGIPGQYIIVLNDNMTMNSISARQATLHSMLANESSLRRTFHSFNGGVVRLTEVEARKLAKDPTVKLVEQDGIVTGLATQTKARGHIDRIDQASLPLNMQYSYNQTGNGVTAYIIDSGIRTTHTEFEGRATNSYDVFGGNGSDCSGHGTHVAGLVGSKTYGVAKNVKLVGVKVLDCNSAGTISGVISGVDWVTRNAVKPAVVNMSLGTPLVSAAMDTAVQNSINSGLTYVFAAGNSSDDACKHSPADVKSGITVGWSSDLNDARSVSSSYGSCVDVFAPGSIVLSTWYTNDTALNYQSGTSMSSPVVAGVAAMYLELHPTSTPVEVQAAIVSYSVHKITNAGAGSPDLLIQSNVK